jgi:hypothetical protein
MNIKYNFKCLKSPVVFAGIAFKNYSKIEGLDIYASFMR